MSTGAAALYRFLAPVLAGAIFTLGLSPFDIWVAVPLSAALLAALLHRPNKCSDFAIGWRYGLGVFASGASWVYVSIHVYGGATMPLAALMTGAFCAGLALLFALQAYVYGRWFKHQGTWALCASFPALWVLFEWLRSWLLTGFPWLYAGYAAIDIPLAGWAPVAGVYGASLWLVGFGATATALFYARPENRKRLAIYLAALALFATSGALLKRIEWTKPVGEPIRVALYQPNIDLEAKWNRQLFRQHLNQYRTATQPLYSQSDIILWPESALPAYRHQVTPFLTEVDTLARQHNSALITGIPIRADSGRHNSIIAIGNGTGEHHKQKLVPFGEYVPLEQWLRGVIGFFDLPMSSFTPGPQRPPRLTAGELTIAPFICYEIVYPGFVSRHSNGSNLLVTVSNDSWFGASVGPLQHLQMARFRALETGLPLLRGTNNGISAIIGRHGEIQAQSAQFIETTLVGEVQPRSGRTLITQVGHWPVLAICLVVLLWSRRAR